MAPRTRRYLDSRDCRASKPLRADSSSRWSPARVLLCLVVLRTSWSSTFIDVRKTPSLCRPASGTTSGSGSAPARPAAGRLRTYFVGPATIYFCSYLGFWTSCSVKMAAPCVNGAFPRSKAGVRSTSLGMMPLLSRLYMPSLMSFSVMGGGSANGSSLKFLGRIRLAWNTLLGRTVPMPSFSSSMLLIPP